MKNKILTLSLFLVSATAHSQGDWSLGGNSVAGTEFLGTLNPQPLRLFTQGTERMRIAPNGRIGINITTPINVMHLHNPDNLPGTQLFTQWTTGTTNSTSTFDGLRIGLINRNNAAFNIIPTAEIRYSEQDQQTAGPLV